MPAPTAPRCTTRRSVGIVMAAGHHGRIHRDKYFKRGEPMPVAMVLGGDPLAFFYGGLEAPYGVFELDIVGGMRGRPMKMVRGKVTGLPFPANAEIVLEGYVTPDKRPCRRPVRRMDRTLCRRRRADARCSTSRRSITATIRSCSACRRWAAGPDEMARYRAVMRSATIKQNIDQCRRARACSRSGATRSAARACCTASRSRSAIPGHAVQAAHVAAQCGASAYASKYIVVVDDDVDVTNLDHLLWAMLTRTDPKESIQFITGSWDSSADPALPPERRAAGNMTHSVALINACKPWHWRDKFPADQHAEPRGDAQGAGEIRLAARRQRAIGQPHCPIRCKHFRKGASLRLFIARRFCRS